ncbi:ROK family transcriptional regulator [Gryllotalpicola kribbensis]|jgi:predicted NBD/HSP70 family sugar kinase|uniref:ROK family transcriptional regulator n=1 Tax=Gryllotalpicola kribbensis TaxID=993084 RepID=A0ABP8AU23_9MICO
MSQLDQSHAARPALRPRQLAEKALPEHNRRHNRALVLQHLFYSGALSRADLARTSGLTRVTVGDLVAELQSEGIVHELGQRQGTRPGKPATLVEIDADAFHIAAIDLSPGDAFAGVVTNLRGEVLHRLTQPLAGATGEAAIEKVLILVAGLIGAAGSRLLGIGVGTPGIVDGEGIVRQAPNLGWYDLDLGARIRRAFDYPVHVANDANAAALGVRTVFPARGEGGEGDGATALDTAESLLVVRVEHGVGAGLVIGGELVQGEQFAAGEIGHVVIDEDGEECVCGRRGCLEVIIAAPHLKRRLAAAGDEGHEQVLTDAGRALGLALSPVISILNLNLVVLSGPAELIGGRLIDTARQTIQARTMSAVSNGLDLRTATGDEDLVLLGAAVLVLQGELGVS